MEILNAPLAYEIIKRMMSKILGKDVSKLRLRMNICERYSVCLIFIEHKMTVYLNVFRFIVINWISGDVNHDTPYIQPNPFYIRMENWLGC